MAGFNLSEHTASTNLCSVEKEQTFLLVNTLTVISSDLQQHFLFSLSHFDNTGPWQRAPMRQRYTTTSYKGRYLYEQIRGCSKYNPSKGMRKTNLEASEKEESRFMPKNSLKYLTVLAIILVSKITKI